MRLRPCARFFTDPVYRVSYVVVCSRPQDFRPTVKKLLRRTELVDPAAVLQALDLSDGGSVHGCNGRTFRLSPTVGSTVFPLVVIWLHSGAFVSVLAHEAWHAVRWVLRERGVFLDSEGSDEPVAYYLDWLICAALGRK